MARAETKVPRFARDDKGILGSNKKRGTCGGSDAQNPHSNDRFPNRMTLTQGDIMLADTVQPETETT
jgi:hypothetical protein